MKYNNSGNEDYIDLKSKVGGGLRFLNRRK